MARFALDCFCVGMGPSERKIRPLVVECLFGDGGDILLSPLVFGVALLTVPTLCEPSVRALLRIHIFPDILVAVETQGILCRFVEPLVASGAFLFPLRMTLDDLARHEGGLYGVCPQRRIKQDKRSEHQKAKIGG